MARKDRTDDMKYDGHQGNMLDAAKPPMTKDQRKERLRREMGRNPHDVYEEKGKRCRDVIIGKKRWRY